MAPRAPEKRESVIAACEFLRRHADADEDLLAVADLLEDIGDGKWTLVDARKQGMRDVFWIRAADDA